MQSPKSVAPISNELAERLIIGRLLVDPEAIGKVMPTLLPEAFIDETYREIYRTALMLQCQNAAPTVEAVSAWLMALDLLSDEMKSVLQDCHNIARAQSGEILLPAVRLVMTKYLRRIAASMGEKLSEMAGDFSLPVEELVSRATWSAKLLQKLLPDCTEHEAQASES
jgi:replicative DNA helicase